MSSLYIDRKNVEIRSDGGAIVFYENDERIGTVPTAPIDRIIIKGNATITTKVLGEIGKHGIGIIILSGYQNTPSLFFPAPHNDAERRVCQCVLSQDKEFRRLFSVNLVREKIITQAQLLDEIYEEKPQAGIEFNRHRNWVHQDAERVYDKITLDELRGIEGHAAASYFQALSCILKGSLNFTGRNKRPPTDPFNAVLSLTYTLFIADSALSIYSAGLDPFVGFLHAADFARFSFACDLVEPFRATADRFAMQLFKEGTLRPEDFSTTEKGCLMGKAARTRFYPAFERAAAAWRPLIQKRAMKYASDFVTEIASRQKTVVISDDLPDEEETPS